MDVNHKGAVYADLGIKPIDTKKLKCLNGEELGSPEYTLEGWLDLIKNSYLHFILAVGMIFYHFNRIFLFLYFLNLKNK